MNDTPHSDLVERYENLVKTGAAYAAGELNGAPISTFEIYIGHFREIGKEIAAALQPDRPGSQTAVRALEWEASPKLAGGFKLTARDCFGGEFARLDLTKRTTDADIEAFKADRQKDYTQRIRSALVAALDQAPAADGGEVVTVTYTNWRGETSQREIRPLRLWFGSTEWHPDPQWLITAKDTGKGVERDFALTGFAAAPTSPTGETAVREALNPPMRSGRAVTLTSDERSDREAKRLHVEWAEGVGYHYFPSYDHATVPSDEELAEILNDTSPVTEADRPLVEAFDRATENAKARLATPTSPTGETAVREALEPVCEHCSDIGYVEHVSGGIWTGEGVKSHLSYCDCLAGQDARRASLSQSSPAVEGK